jgi:hypothetical protein
MKFVTGPDQVYFRFKIGVFILKFPVKSNFELLILELLLFGGFFLHFDLADLN